MVSLIRAPGPLPARSPISSTCRATPKARRPSSGQGDGVPDPRGPVAGPAGGAAAHRARCADARSPGRPSGFARSSARRRPGAAPRITGIGRAFHVPGNLPGESETQIFLQTADSRPVSLSVLRRPGETPRWAVALSEIVDEAAVPPAPGTLLWYRLACTLPRACRRRASGDVGRERRRGDPGRLSAGARQPRPLPRNRRARSTKIVSG
jgi:hypothetical protein